jgi:O-antigen/teichoic acid export membrane protein
MRIFAGVVWIRFIAEAFGLLLTTSGNQFLRVIITAVATILNVGVNLVVIPAMGPMGAAMVSLGTNLLVAAGCLIAIRRSYPLPVVGWRTGTVVALTAAIAGLVWTLRELPLCASLPVSVASCVLLGLYVGLTRDERRKLFSFRIPAQAEGSA